MTIGSSSATLSGVPTTAGTYTFSVNVVDSSTIPLQGRLSVTIVVTAPTITSITNQADGSNPPLAPGSLAIMTGTGLTAPLSTASANPPYPTTLGNVIVTVNGRAAPVFFVGTTQINFQIPYETLTGPATVVVNNNGAVSNSFPLTIAAAAPGLYGNAIQNQSSPFGINSAGNRAISGTTVTVLFSGLGVVSPAVADGALAPASPASTSSLTTTATFNSSPVTPTGVALAPGTVGVAQASIPIPAGLPTGSYSLTITVNGVTSAAVTVFVQVAPLVISTTPIASGEVNNFYSLASFTATGGVPPYTFAFQGAATSFNNMTLVSNAFSGYPAAASTTPVPVQVTDANSPTPTTVTASVPWTVFSAINITLPPNNQGVLTPTVVTNTFASFTFSASGGNGGPYTWGTGAVGDSVRPGVPLPTSPQALLRRDAIARARLAATPPPIRKGKQLAQCYPNPPLITAMGMDINPATGVFSGTPTVPCRYFIGLDVTDGIGVQPTGVTLLVSDPLVNTTPPLSPGVLNQVYNSQGLPTLAATGGDPDDPSPFTWTASPLPPGITLNTSNPDSPSLTGTPTAVGTTNVVIHVTDPNTGLSATPVTLPFTVYPVLSITTASLPNGAQNQAYPNTQLVAAGGSGSYTWSATGLPAGLTLDSTGLLHGTPATVGNDTSISIAVTDATSGQQVTQGFSINVLNPSTTTLVTSASPSIFGQQVVLTATVTGAGSTDKVTFYDGAAVLGTSGVSALNGQATLATKLLATGAHTLKAYYLGNANTGPSASATSPLQVNTLPQAGFAAGVPYTVGSAPSLPAAGDFNGDGNIDLAVPNVNSNNISILLGNSNGTFGSATNFPTGTSPQAVVTGDFNGDGKIDLAVAALGSNSVSILLGNGDGTFQTFTPVPAGTTPYRLVVGDFNSDGRADLAVSNLSAGTYTILLGKGDGTFQSANTVSLGGSLNGIAAGDFNGDGKSDLVVTSFNGQSVEVLLGNGDGTFTAGSTPLVGLSPVFVLATDLNGDGKIDLAVANSSASSISVLLGNGDGTFQTQAVYTVGSAPFSIVAADLNDDGRADLAVANNVSGTVTLLTQQSNGTFVSGGSLTPGGNPLGIAVADFNQDGRPDLAVTDNAGTKTFIYLGSIPQPSVSCPFAPPILTGTPYTTTCVASGGVGPYTFSLTGGALPTGLGPINSSTGVISGTPTATGPFSPKIQVIDSDTPPQTSSQTVNVTVYNPVSITAITPPVGITNAAYTSTQFAATGGSGAYTWAATGLPPGLGLSTSGLLTGTPTTIGTYSSVNITATDATASTSKTATFSISVYNPLVITTSSLHAGDVSSTYTTVTLAATGGSGATTWTATGLPGGVTLTAGVLGGTPTTTGTFNNVQITAHDAPSGQNVTSTFTINVFAALSITTPSLPNGVTNAAYPSTTLTTSGGSGSFSWAATGLPGGLALSTAGVLTGTPTAAGTSASVNITVTDTAALISKTSVFSITVYNPVTVSTSSVPNGLNNSAYTNTTLAATGGSNTTYTWTSTGAALPTGLTLTSAGLLSGTPTVSGTFTGIQFTASDAVSTLSGSKTFTLIVYNPVTVTTTSLPPGVTGQAYTSTQLQATGGSGNYTWAATGLPANLTLSVAGVLSGTPSAAGTTTSINITATDATAGLNGSKTFSISVYNALQITTPSPLPSTITGSFYSATFSASGGSGTVTWSATGLPPGFNMNLGTLIGTSTTAGSYTNINVTATDTTASQNTSKIFTLNVYDPLQITTVSLPNGVTGQAYSLTMTSTGGSGSGIWTATGLPSPLTMSGAGVVSGSPAAAGVSSSVVITLTDAVSGQISQKTYSLTVQNPATLLLTTSGTPSTFGGPVTLTAAITPPGATGQVTFYDGVNVLGTSTLASGSAQLITSLLPSGLRPLTAFYAGTALVLPARSNTAPQNVKVLPQFGFQPVTTSNSSPGTTPEAVAAGDFNGDGKEDLVLANSNGRVSVLLGNGDGTFQTATSYLTGGLQPFSIAIADFNADGKTDLVVANELGNNAAVLLGNGDGTFQTAITIVAGAKPSSVVVADFNRDGFADFAVANSGGTTITLVLGNGNGTFQPAATIPAGGSPSFIVAADFNGDGKPDLATANAGGTFSVLLGNGDGTFQTAVSYLAQGTLVGGFAAGDVNGDTIPDLIFADNTSGNILVFPGTAAGTFPSTPLQSFNAGTGLANITLGDFNGDGVQDVAAAFSSGTVVKTFAGNGNGTFQAGTGFGTVPASGVLAVGDFNADGRSDLVTVDGPNSQADILPGAIPQPTVSCTLPSPPLLTTAPFTGTCTAISGVAPYTYSISGGGLPGGVSLNSSTGALSGTPAAGAFSFTVKAVDSDTPVQNATKTYSGTVYNPLVITTSALPVGIKGAAYTSTTLVASGGSGGYAWSATGLPGGLSLSAAGVLGGIPTAAGSFTSVQITVTDAAAGLATPKTFTINVYNPLSITTLSLPVGITNTAYTSTTLTKAGGSGSVTWAATGLPTGLSLSAAGVLTGTPTTAGTSANVQVTATDATAGVNATATFTINVYNPLSITTSSLPNGVTGTAYTSTTLAATGGSGGYSWSATGLPGGLSLSTAGVLSGTPTTAGAFTSVVVTLADAAAGLSTPKTFTINVYNPLSITTSSLPVGITNTAYTSATLTKTGGSGTVTWSATGLPAGLSLSTAGVLTGTPTAAGTSASVQITATDATASLSATATFTINVYNPLSITTSSLPNGLTGTAYTSTTLASTGGSGTATWSATGLPAGLSVSAAGVLSGTPTAAGAFSSVQVTLTDAAAAQNASRTFTVVVYNPVTVTTSSLPFGIQNKAYTSTTLAATGGSNTTYSWTATGLPTGLALSTAGVLTGTPTAAGTFSSVQVTAADATSGLSGSQTYTIPVYAPIVITTSALPNGAQGQAYSAPNLAATGGSSSYTWSATGLPTGINLSSAGLLSGTPTVSGTFSSISVTATDTVSGQTASQSFSIILATPTTITLQSSGTPSSIFGAAVTLTAKVTPAAATGQVTFYDGTTVLGTSTLANGTATYTTPLLSAGPRQLRAYYLGRPAALASSSSVVAQTVKVLPEKPFAPAVTYATGNNPDGVAVADFNGDGKLDVVVANYNSSNVGVYLGTGTGTLSSTPIVAATDRQPNGVAIGDFNGDGKPDIAVVSSLHDAVDTVDILLGNGDGTFQPFVPYNVDTLPLWVAVGDFNGDGKADLVTASQANGTVSVLLGNGDGTFQAAVNYPAVTNAQAVVIGDFNGDGKADLAVANSTGTGVSILLGNGNGTFGAPASFPTSQLPFGLTTADFNGDSKLDLAVATTTGVNVLLGNGDGTFQGFINYPAGNGLLDTVVAGDFFGSGNLSLVAADESSNISVLAGAGDGTFGAAVTFPKGGTGQNIVAVADFNGDGRSDLALTNNINNTLAILLGQIPQPALTCNLGTAPVVTGTAYNFPCPATGGVGPYTYSISSGSLPTGLSLNTSTGAITGTPLVTGAFTFTVKAVDSDTPPQSATFTGSITVATPLVITSSLFGGVFGTAYSATLATGGTTPYNCTLTAGSLPNGLTLDPSTCVLSGAPTLGAVFAFTIGITDAGTPPQTGSPTYSVTITYPPLSITTSALPLGVQNQTYSSVNFTATGGSNSYSWSATGLPTGLTLSPAGVLSGSPTIIGTFANVNVTLTDSVSAATISKTYSLTVYPPLLILTSVLPQGQAGQAYNPVTLQATGGSGTYVWSATGLPAGFSITTAGVISGPPIGANTYNVTVTVTDATAKQTASKLYSLVIVSQPQPPPPVPPLQISGIGDLGGVPLGHSVSGSFSATGGKQPYTFSATGLPAGVTINATTGAISGTPTSPGTYSFVVVVTDSAGAGSSLPGTFTVLGITTTALPAATAGQSYSQPITALGGTGTYTFTATALPPGLTLSAAGTVSGKPTLAGSYSISATVTDTRSLSASASVTLQVNPAPPLKILTTALPDAPVSQPYSQTLSASGGLGPYTWIQSGGSLPAGLTLSSAGTLSGIPTAAGPFSFSVQVTDTAGATLIGSVSINVKPAPLQLSGSLPAGVVNVDYPLQILSVSGGVGPYTYSINGSLPAGLTFSSGTISGIPATVGTTNFTIVVTDATGATSSVPASIVVRAANADLILSGSAVSFALSTAASGLPTPDAITVRSSDVTQVLNYSVAFTPAPWLSVVSGSTTPNTITISLNNQALSLAATPAPYTSTITVTCLAPSPCAGSAQTIGVSLLVSSPPPQLGVSTNLLSFTATGANPPASTQSLGIQNIGGGTLGIGSISAPDSWITVGSIPATLASGPGVSVSITADPTGLQPGYYLSTVSIVTSAGNANVAVTLLVSTEAIMTLGPAGEQFSLPAGGVPGNPNGSFLVAVSSSSPVSWTASVLPGSNWLVVNTPAGTSTGTAPGTVKFSIDPNAAAALTAGAYYGTIRITAAGVVNSPQDFQVVLSVAPATSSALPDPEPPGLIFLSSGTTALPAQTVQIFASSKTPVPYQASAATTTGGSWLSVTPSTGTTQASAPAQSAVSINATGLAPGVYRGGVSYAFSVSAVRTVNVTLIVEPVAPPGDSARGISATGCKPTQLVPTQTGLVSNFSAPAAWPVPLAISLIDDCGNAIAGGQVVTTFSNGDPPQVLSLVDGNTGLYSATWTPRKTSSQVTIAAKATAAGFPAATAQIIGQVTPNIAPLLTPHATLHIFNPQVGGGLGPGNIVQIYGTDLASSTVSPTAIPLPTVLGGTSVIIGGVQAPLFFVSSGQVNAQIPFELAAGQQYQVIVNANGALTTPDSIQLTAVAPGIAAFASGEIIAQHPDGSLISDTAPAKAGEYIVFYMAGLGNTDNPVTTGAASPGDPLARPQSAPTLTIGGEHVDILFAGLTPGLVGLYQVNAQVPADAKAGLLPLVITQAGTASNSTLLPVQ